MIEQNHECYVSLEVAKLLKQAGFDWKVDTLYFSMQDDDYLIKEELIKCTDYFTNGDQRGTKNIFHNWNQLNTKRGDYYTFVSKKDFLEFDYEIIKKDTTLISAPTLDVAQRWLREVKRIFISISSGLSEHMVYDCKVVDWRSGYNENYYVDDIFNTYEEAQETGIKEALEIIS